MKILDLFKKKNKTIVMSEVMADKETKRYQWKKGENFGKIVEVKTTDMDFIYFTDGSRIFKNISNEFLEEVKDGRVPLPGAEQAAAKLNGEVVSTESSIIQPETQTTSVNTANAVINQPIVKEPTVMGKMIMKMSKKNLVTVPIQINLNIPTPELYAVLSGGMETEDLNEEIMEVALSQIEMDKLQDYIKANVTDFLSQYYS